MRLRSTRSEHEAGFLEAVDRGIAPDGGLYLPVELPRLPDPDPGLADDFHATAGWALRHLLAGALEPPVLDRVVDAALDLDIRVEGPWRTEGGEISLLDLTRGPTRAFKDVGARFLAALWSLRPAEGGRTVLVATSGDTGGAVADACHGLPGLRVVVLFPEGRVSELQRKQFTTLGGNVHTVSVAGPFDRCQALVKGAFADDALRERWALTSANSINIGRLLPQLLPWLHLARTRGWGRAGGVVAGGDGSGPGPVVVVPSGNLGNVWAAMAARRCGAPLGPIVAACNRNDTLVRWLRDRRTDSLPTLETPSTAMDVGRPSNLERVRLFVEEGEPLLADAVDDETTLSRMRDAAGRGRRIDPHTAVGWEVAERLLRGDLGSGEGSSEVVVGETASPAKFPEVLREAGVDPVEDAHLSAVLDAPERSVSLGPDDDFGALLDALLERGDSA